ncbi:MAG: hypothetical protein JSS81_01400 [Acidobacteria bacterium]|nr:hypothetical protein [Acidobacteriota bacterium]
MKRIKRTKITVIRTETVFLKRTEDENVAERQPVKTPFFLDDGDRDRIIEVERIDRIVEQETEGEQE